MGSTGIHGKPVNHPPAVPCPPEARRSSLIAPHVCGRPIQHELHLADGGPKLVNEQMTI